MRTKLAESWQTYTLVKVVCNLTWCLLQTTIFQFCWQWERHIYIIVLWTLLMVPLVWRYILHFCFLKLSSESYVSFVRTHNKKVLHVQKEVLYSFKLMHSVVGKSLLFWINATTFLPWRLFVTWSFKCSTKWQWQSVFCSAHSVVSTLTIVYWLHYFTI